MLKAEEMRLKKLEEEKAAAEQQRLDALKAEQERLAAEQAEQSRLQQLAAAEQQNKLGILNLQDSIKHKMALEFQRKQEEIR